MLVCTDFRFPPPGGEATSQNVQLQLTRGAGANAADGSVDSGSDQNGGGGGAVGARRAADAFSFMPQLQPADRRSSSTSSQQRHADQPTSRTGGATGGRSPRIGAGAMVCGGWGRRRARLAETLAGELGFLKERESSVFSDHHCYLRASCECCLSYYSKRVGRI